MVDVQTVSIMLASASVIAGVVYYAFQLRHQSHMIQQQNKARETDLLVNLYKIFTGKEFSRDVRIIFGHEYLDYDSFVKKYGSPAKSPTTKEEREYKEALCSVMNQMELFGHLLRRRIVTADLMYEIYSGIFLWEHVKPLVEGIRRDQNDPLLWEPLEYYYNEMKKYEQKLQQSKA